MSIDIAVNTFMQSLRNPIITGISKFINVLFEPLILVAFSIIISLFLFYKGKKKESYIFAASVVSMAIILYLTKEVFARARPLNSIIVETGYSFPSGHAFAAVVFFGLIAYLLAKKKNKLEIYFISALLILLTGFSRIYLGVHWLTDVLAGFLFGGIILITSIILLKVYQGKNSI